jgi:adenosylhomocysteine nucleosidase
VTRVLVLTAVDVETRGLARHLGLPRVADSTWPRFAAGALEIACVGLRASQLRARAEGLRPFDLVVSAGACGALAPELTTGALVVPEVVVDQGGGRWPAARMRPLPAAGTLVTVADVVATPAQKSRLWLETGARAVDMESAAILVWAAERGAPAAVVRAVADTAERGIPAALAASVADDGRVRPLRAVTAALARATSVSGLLELRAGTEAALKTVAAALATLARET